MLEIKRMHKKALHNTLMPRSIPTGFCGLWLLYTHKMSIVNHIHKDYNILMPLPVLLCFPFNIYIYAVHVYTRVN